MGFIVFVMEYWGNYALLAFGIWTCLQRGIVQHFDALRETSVFSMTAIKYSCQIVVVRAHYVNYSIFL